MAKQPEFTKYLPLDAWFKNRPASEKQIDLTFDEVAQILGAPLPGSAYKLKTWWTNKAPKIQSHRTSWTNHGWLAETFDLDKQTVRFVRGKA